MDKIITYLLAMTEVVVCPTDMKRNIFLKILMSVTFNGVLKTDTTKNQGHSIVLSSRFILLQLVECANLTDIQH